MPNFEDSFGDTFVNEGWHDVTLVSFAHSELHGDKTPKIEFVGESEDGKCPKLRFHITPNAAYRFKGFAIACGMTKEERLAIDEPTPFENAIEASRQLIGRTVGVLCLKGEVSETTGKQYMEAKEYRQAGLKLAAPKPKQEPARAAMTRQPSVTDDELPF